MDRKHPKYPFQKCLDNKFFAKFESADLVADIKLPVHCGRLNLAQILPDQAGFFGTKSKQFPFHQSGKKPHRDQSKCVAQREYYPKIKEILFLIYFFSDQVV